MKQLMYLEIILELWQVNESLGMGSDILRFHPSGKQPLSPDVAFFVLAGTTPSTASRYCTSETGGA